MKVNINTNHLRIYKLLGFTSYKTVDFIAEFLKMDKQNVILYIKQIYSFIDSEKKKLNTQSIINKIISDVNLINQLKEYQKFTKANRIFYMILILLRDKYINLNTLALELDVSRRVLSNDLIHVKNNLKMYNIEVNSSNAKGISLSGDIENIKIASLSYLYKFFIEFDYLPNNIIKNFENFFCQKFKASLDEDIELFINNFNFDFFCQNKSLLKSFFIVYVNQEKTSESTISDLSFENFKKYFIEVVQPNFLEALFNFFQNSSLGNILLKDINIFINTLKFCNGDLKNPDIILTKEINTMKSLIFKNLSVLIDTNSFLEKFINKVTLTNYRNNSLFICEMV
ncbi:helix-turn-helix domain-containing protein [Cetobacterium somerae]|uniref:helix-turn-helix domain-containing protein n=1 Tax=Cetobacterium somerae TaxID=188913 RepID=UPI00211E805A|nr:helix-turn-helix domain-containing protein [Cetobacterium somerae]MCQ9628502.1 helix-turn-helix domain-containing protein [Cetobacterium somerae]